MNEDNKSLKVLRRNLAEGTKNISKLTDKNRNIKT